ncbi:MAG TPA: tail fiber domain-containing protein, partial [Nitrososphaera sp.]|nr:tail fiber domain-containing protein [Nitrososphaera sp.]
VTALGFTPSAGGGGGSTSANSVLNVAALRTAPSVGGTQIMTRGYYTARDGGAATYYLDTTDTTSPDNGGDVIVASDGGRWKLAKGVAYSARQFGARGNSTLSSPGADDTVALQRFVNFLGTGGYKGYIPGGRYRITKRINIADNCSLYGDGWKDIRDITGYNTRNWAQSKVYGTIIYSDYVDTGPDTAVTFYIEGNSCIIEDMEFETLQPLPGPGWTCNNTPTAIWCFRGEYAEQGGNGLLLRNIMIRNYKNGIKMIGAARATIDGLFGECFHNFVDITANYDVVRINNVHINFPFYSGNSEVIKYLGANSVGITFGRVDNPVWSNIFIFYARIAMKFYTDTTPTGGFEGGVTQRLQITNLGIDLCNVGFYASDAIRLSLANFYVLCRNDPTESFNSTSRCIHNAGVLGGGYVPISMNLVNGDFQGSALECMRFDVPGVVNLSNVVIRTFNLAGTGAPAISVGNGVKVFAANVALEEPNSAPLFQVFGTGTYSDAHSGSTGGTGSGVSSFNTRSGAVTLTGTDIVNAIATTTVPINTPSTFRATNKTFPTTGTGTEISYDPNFSSGYLLAYDRGTNTYKDMAISGRNLTFQSGTAGANQGSFDINGRFLLGYATSIGSHKLQVDGEGFFSGALYALTPPTNTTGTRVATCDYVIAKVGSGGGGGGVTSFNGRAGAVTLTNTDVNAAYGAQPTFTGYPAIQTSIEGFGTIRSTNTSIPSSGTGIEISYNSSLVVGFLTCYDRSAGQYRDLGIAGRNVTFQSGNGANAASFDQNGSLLIGYPSTNGSGYKLQVNSQIYATSASIATSDRSVKENISPLKSGLKEVMKLKPVTYTFVEHKVHNFPKGTQVGFIAQDIEKLLAKEGYKDGIVASNDDGLKGLAEVKLVPLLVRALQELNDKFEAYVKLHP